MYFYYPGSNEMVWGGEYGKMYGVPYWGGGYYILALDYA